MTKTEKQSSFGNRRLFPLLIAASLCVPVSAWAGAVYLAAVGPPPLRFRPAFKTYLHIPTPPLPVPVPTAVPPPVEKTEKAPAPAPAATAQIPVPAVDQTNLVVGLPRADGVVSPQMLLKYFSRSTNSNAAGVNAPLDFTPPRPIEPPSSKAEYTTPPHKF